MLSFFREMRKSLKKRLDVLLLSIVLMRSDIDTFGYR